MPESSPPSCSTRSPSWPAPSAASPVSSTPQQATGLPPRWGAPRSARAAAPPSPAPAPSAMARSWRASAPGSEFPASERAVPAEMLTPPSGPRLPGAAAPPHLRLIQRQHLLLAAPSLLVPQRALVREVLQHQQLLRCAALTAQRAGHHGAGLRQPELPRQWRHSARPLFPSTAPAHLPAVMSPAAPATPHQAAQSMPRTWTAAHCARPLCGIPPRSSSRCDQPSLRPAAPARHPQPAPTLARDCTAMAAHLLHRPRPPAVEGRLHLVRRGPAPGGGQGRNHRHACR